MTAGAEADPLGGQFRVRPALVIQPLEPGHVDEELGRRPMARQRVRHA